MGVKLPEVSAKELSRILIRLGFKFRSQKGSHIKFVRESFRSKEIVIIPNHRVIRKGTLHNTIQRLNLSLREFLDLLNS